MDGAVPFCFPFPGSAIGEKKPGTVFSSRKLSPTKAPNACVRARRREPREYRPGSLRGFREGELSTPFHKYGCIRDPPPISLFPHLLPENPCISVCCDMHHPQGNHQFFADDGI